MQVSFICYYTRFIYLWHSTYLLCILTNKLYVKLIIYTLGKGVVGGYIWTHWYDWIDSFLDLDSDYNIYKAFGAVATVNNYDEWIRSHLAIVTTALSLVIEQFIWCPIVFGSFEIPVSTLLNGGSLSNVQQEVEAKIGGLLVSNAKVWTILCLPCP